jgi:hypothetical protein
MIVGVVGFSVEGIFDLTALVASAVANLKR